MNNCLPISNGGQDDVHGNIRKEVGMSPKNSALRTALIVLGLLFLGFAIVFLGGVIDCRSGMPC